jgi:hypothetical protein
MQSRIKGNMTKLDEYWTMMMKGKHLIGRKNIEFVINAASV